MKRMEPQSKLGLIQQLGLGRVCTQWGAGLPVQEDEVELASKYAKLLAAIVTGDDLQLHANTFVLEIDCIANELFQAIFLMHYPLDYTADLF